MQAIPISRHLNGRQLFANTYDQGQVGWTLLEYCLGLHSFFGRLAGKLLFRFCKAGSTQMPWKTTVLLLITVCPILAKAEATIDQLEAQEALDSALRASKELEQQFEAMTRARRLQCVKAVGHQQFCDCLMDELPVGIDSFAKYALFVDLSAPKLDGADMTESDEFWGGPGSTLKVIEQVKKTRNGCVTKHMDF